MEKSHELYKRVEVAIPATTANLGSGFDCLALALNLWNTVILETGVQAITISGEGEHSLSRGPDNLVYQAVRTLLDAAGVSMNNFSLICHNVIPLERGLGSSSAAVVGGLLAANALCDKPFPLEEILHMAAKLEGHPDNVAAAIFGGCQIVVQDGQEILAAPVPIPAAIRAVLFIPDQSISTNQARLVLASEVSREDAVFNLSRVALLVNALATNQTMFLRRATQDRIHQRHRRILFPSMDLIFQAAMAAGALGVFLSGAGSTILALAQGREMTIGYEMMDVAEKSGVSGSVRVLDLSAKGAQEVRLE
jgi:homoserine kinase